MSSKILINAVDPEECRIAKVRDSRLEEFHIETTAREFTQGNIYKGVITRVEPGLQSVFVDYGADRHGFLQKSEIHRDYFQDTGCGDLNIKNIVKKGQELFVQVVKDPILNKGAMLTTFLSLPGRYIVLMPGNDQVGISRKIEGEEERSRLKEIIGKISVPEDFGVIVRTAGRDCNKTQITKDLRYLLRLWKDINKKGIEDGAPSLLYKERNLAVRSIRDYFTPDIVEILVDNQAVHKELRDFMHIISPKHAKIVKLFKGEKPIFTKYQLETQIASVFENRVNLKTGGSVVIDQTEALVAIDVNSGKMSQKSVEQTAFQTNLEAAEEITRQLRLRDLGGLIVIDFIDMRESRHNIQVEKALKTHLKQDKARTKVGRISKFGLLEMSRQRIRPFIEYGSYSACRHCRGKGRVPSVEMLGLGFLRKLQLETIKNGISQIKAVVSVEVADYLLNKKRKEILELERRYGIWIRIEGKVGLVLGESEITSDRQEQKA